MTPYKNRLILCVIGHCVTFCRNEDLFHTEMPRLQLFGSSYDFLSLMFTPDIWPTLYFKFDYNETFYG